MSFICNSNDDKKEMINRIGLSSISELFKDIPDSIKMKEPLPLADAISEQEVLFLLKDLASQNKRMHNFIGAGVYQHYLPALVDHLTARSEFYSAYTPYQPEVSQGTLTAIFEFQSMLCNLTGMDVANASLYDGATAASEAVLMSIRANRKNKILIAQTIHPHYLAVIKTYAWANDLEIEILPEKKGLIDVAEVNTRLNDDVSAIVIQSPNFFGCIEDVKSISEATENLKTNLIMVINEPFSMGILQMPALLGADIVCGEAASFGNPIAFGGPGLGFLAARKSFMRSMPGRLVGKTSDHDGKECYVLTLQTREQHIRRERATSNICTNQGLCALRSVIFLSHIGNKLVDIAKLNHRLTSYLKDKLFENGIKSVFENPFFNEIAVKVSDADRICTNLQKEKINPGLNLGRFFPQYKDVLLLCCTEVVTEKEIDYLVTKIKEYS